MQIISDLKNWSKHLQGDEVYFWGSIHNDSKRRWRNGTRIHTSYVKSIVETDECFIVSTRNSVYRLWKCDKKVKGDGDQRQGIG